MRCSGLAEAEKLARVVNSGLVTAQKARNKSYKKSTCKLYIDFAYNITLCRRKCASPFDTSPCNSS